MKTIDDARHHIGAFLGACKDSGMQAEHVRAVLLEYLGLPEETSEGAGTPGLRWAVEGQPDPHGSAYDCERAALTLGALSDDELANEAFLNYDRRPPVEKVVAGTAFMPIVYMTAVKERIRWLSRALAKATQPASTTGTKHPC
jgi:hypothetical protein